MQISSGWARGLKLATPPGDVTRPTAAKVRAAVLNMLVQDLPEAQFLDLCAGSGAMGIEALSRGARTATFVEPNPKAQAALKQNLKELARRAAAQELAPPEVTLLASDAVSAMARLGANVVYNVVFLDPPYRDVLTLLRSLSAPLARKMASSGILVVESDAADGPAVDQVLVEGGVWEQLRQRAYGETMISIYGRVSAEG